MGRMMPNHCAPVNPETGADQRQDLLRQWLEQVLPAAPDSLLPASSDASFRRYFRVRCKGHSLIAMDAPPQLEDCRPFIHIARRLREAGVNVPEVTAADEQLGFLLLSDFGDIHYLRALTQENADRLYGEALEALLRLQRAPAGDLPPYDRELLWREMELFRDWLCRRLLGLDRAALDGARLDETFEDLTRSALEQPRCFVHRDYHSRNLMLTAEDNPGVLDFQDAVEGPVTYDLVSLLRDCYLDWPRERVEAWALNHHERMCRAGLLPGMPDEGRFLRWFDLMGVQRHLKAAGIFARLWLRDGKPGYLADIPRTLQYIVEIGSRHPETEGLASLVAGRVLPALREHGA